MVKEQLCVVGSRIHLPAICGNRVAEGEVQDKNGARDNARQQRRREQMQQQRWRPGGCPDIVREGLSFLDRHAPS
ncbi:hypothetical protein D3C71_1101600 [compost metagenome]